MSPPNTMAVQVKLYPELSISALRDRSDKYLALWYELRAIDFKGCSRLVQQDAVDDLVKHFGYSRTTAYRLLVSGAGMDGYWSLYVKPSEPGRTRIRIHSLDDVSAKLHITHLSRPVTVYTDKFRGRGKKRAWLYASFLKPEGTQTNPISRDSIQDATGVLRRQQQRYDKVTGTKRIATFAVQRVNGHLEGMPAVLEGKSRQYVSMRRLGNIYHTQTLKACRGMVRGLNKKLKARSSEGDNKARLPRRFFSKARALVICKDRHDESFLLTRPEERLVHGRLEWEIC